MAHHPSRRCPAVFVAVALSASACAMDATPHPSVVIAPSEPAAVDGDVIAFHSDPNGRDDFYLVGAGGSGLTQLTDGAETVAFPLWSPDGDRIAYVCCAGGTHRVWVMDADGANPLQLTSDESGEPAWSPDGSQLAYVNYEDETIWVAAATGASAMPLVDQAGGPTWSPDGTRIAYFSWADGDNELFVAAADGTDPVQLTDNDADDFGPSWSPDGTQVAFVSDRDGNPEIYGIDPAGGQARRLTDDPATDDAPSWSPDGSRVLFVSYRDGADPLTLGSGNADIFTVAANGSEVANLTQQPTWEGYPAWSPDGTRIAYSSNDGIRFRLFVMNADGTEPIELPGPSPSAAGPNDCCPTWRPR